MKQIIEFTAQQALAQILRAWNQEADFAAWFEPKREDFKIIAERGTVKYRRVDD